MTGAYRMSKRMVEAFCADVFSIPICAGQVCALEAETAVATDSVVEELRNYARRQPANGDETGWWQKRQRGWLWTIVTGAPACRGQRGAAGGPVDGSLPEDALTGKVLLAGYISRESHAYSRSPGHAYPWSAADRGTRRSVSTAAASQEQGCQREQQGDDLSPGGAEQLAPHGAPCSVLVAS